MNDDLTESRQVGLAPCPFCKSVNVQLAVEDGGTDDEAHLVRSGRA